MGLTIIGERDSVCTEQLGRIEDGVIGATLRVSVNNRDVVLAGHLSHRMS